MTAKSNMHVNSEQYKLRFGEKQSLNGWPRMVPDVLKGSLPHRKTHSRKTEPVKVNPVKTEQS